MKGTTRQSKIKTAVLLGTVCLLSVSVYTDHCQASIGVLECFYLSPSDELAKKIGIALFINTSLFLGGLHQWLYVSGT
jgi:hypothetical protein